jgi:hypothetical protein
MIWMLLLSIVVTHTCPAGIPCPDALQQTRVLPGTYRTYEDCERKRVQVQQAFAQPRDASAETVHQRITTTVVCRQQGE